MAQATGLRQHLQCTRWRAMVPKQAAEPLVCQNRLATCRRLVEVAHVVLEYVRLRKSEEWMRQVQGRWRDTDALSASRMSMSDTYKDLGTRTFGVTRFCLNISRPPSRPCVLLLPLLHRLSILCPRCLPSPYLCFDMHMLGFLLPISLLFAVCEAVSSPSSDSQDIELQLNLTDPSLSFPSLNV